MFGKSVDVVERDEVKLLFADREMTGYKIVNLKLILDQFGEERTKAILSEFSCPKNHDVEAFLRQKEIECKRQSK